jgi:hypothetical protein
LSSRGAQAFWQRRRCCRDNGAGWRIGKKFEDEGAANDLLFTGRMLQPPSISGSKIAAKMDALSKRGNKTNQ